MFRLMPGNLSKNKDEKKIMRDAKNAYAFVSRNLVVISKVNKYLDDVLTRPDGEAILKTVRKLASDAIHDIQRSNHPSPEKVARQVKIQEFVNEALQRNEDIVHEFTRIEL